MSLTDKLRVDVNTQNQGFISIIKTIQENTCSIHVTLGDDLIQARCYLKEWKSNSRTSDFIIYGTEKQKKELRLEEGEDYKGYVVQNN